MPRKDPMTAQRDLLRRVKTEGLEAAFEALMAVCKDPKAPAPAKATAGTTIFRAGGAFDKDVQKGHDKPIVEMTTEEIAARLEELRVQRMAFMERFEQGSPLEDEDEAEDVDEAEEDDTDSSGDEEEPKDLFG